MEDREDYLTDVEADLLDRDETTMEEFMAIRRATQQDGIVLPRKTDSETAREDWRARTAWYMRMAGIPESFCGRTWGDFRPVDGKGDALMACRRWCHDSKNGSGLLFCGQVGTGKSFLASLCVRDSLLFGRVLGSSHRLHKWIDCHDSGAYDQEGNIVAWDPGIRWVRVSSLLRQVRRECFDEQITTEEEQIERLSHIPLLILDDIGVRSLSDWGQDFLLTVCDERWLGSRMTIVTANRSLSGMISLLGERICSRLAGMCRVIEVGGEDMRREKS